MNRAVILAGGIGSRVGNVLPKQFIEVLGHPVIYYTIKRFQEHKEIDDIEIVCVKEYMDLIREIVKDAEFDKVSKIVEGGSTFQYSVINGINGYKGLADNDDIILVHYAASPFVTEDIISDAIRVCKENGNSTSATPCFLLMGSNDDGNKSTRWVDRDKYMQLNSPQCFKFGYVTWLYEEAERKKIIDEIEPHTTSLMYALGETIYFSKGNQTNIKITTKEDLLLFKGFLLANEEMGDL